MSKPGGNDGLSVAESLSEEVLLAVFQHLEPRALVLSVGLVCRRWRRVSRDPRLWGRLTLHCFGRKQPDKKRKDLRLLRQAPCLGSLNLRTQLYSDLEVRLVARVAPAKIRSLYACFHKEHTLAELLPLLDRTRAHLRDLTVCREGNEDPEEACEEFWEWFDSSAVEKLTLLGTSLLDSVTDVEFHHRGTLQHFKTSTHVHSVGVLAALLRAHSASLRSVEVKSFCCGRSSEIFSVLSRCPLLRSVMVPSYTDIEKLSVCRELVSVAVEDADPEDSEDSSGAGFPAVLRFLASPSVAPTLTALTMYHLLVSHQEPLFRFLPQLVALRSFTLECCERVAAPELLAATLRRLGQLRRLSLRCVHTLTEDVLAAISTDSVPNLAVLDLTDARCDEKGDRCWESHLDALKERLPEGATVTTTPCKSHS